MEKKTAMLSDVNVSGVGLKELVVFIEELREEFPVAIRILSKRLLAQEYGVVPIEDETDNPHKNDDDKIIDSLRYLEGNISANATEQSRATFILGLHSTFGFGKKRVSRLIGHIAEMKPKLTVDQLIQWCEIRGIDYDEEFGIGSVTKVAATNEKNE